MANSVNYQHLLNVYKIAYLKNNKNACEKAVAEIWKILEKHYPSSDELWKDVDHKANEWKEISIMKKPKMTDFWSGVRKKSTNVTIKLPRRSEKKD